MIVVSGGLEEAHVINVSIPCPWFSTRGVTEELRVDATDEWFGSSSGGDDGDSWLRKRRKMASRTPTMRSSRRVGKAGNMKGLRPSSACLLDSTGTRIKQELNLFIAVT